MASRQRKVKLLSGGNPQIAKAEGDAPVQAYIAAMPGWKRSVGERLDGLIMRTVPDVHKAVKWNQPFYGHEGDGWFLAFREGNELPRPLAVGSREEAVRTNPRRPLIGCADRGRRMRRKVGFRLSILPA